MSSENHFNFTIDRLDAIKAPTKTTRKYYYDTNKKANGLSLAVTEKGTKTFVVYERLNGTPTRFPIGRYNVETTISVPVSHH